MFEYVRAVREVRPRWFLWENVPGALSSEGGEAFRQLLSEMDKLGYGLAWRVLDAQFFGVAQRRRRVFLVGRLGACPPVEVLFEPEGMRGDHPSSREKRQELAAAAERGASSAGFKFHQGAGAGSIGWESEQSPTCTADWHNPAVCIQGSMIGRSDANGPQGSGIEQDGASFTLNCTDRHGVLAFAQNTRDEVGVVGDGTLSGALAASPGMKQTTYVCETANNNSNGLGACESDLMKTLDTNNSAAVAVDPVICMADDNAKAAIDENMCGSLKVGGSAPSIAQGRMVVRRAHADGVRAPARVHRRLDEGSVPRKARRGMPRRPALQGDREQLRCAGREVDRRANRHGGQGGRVMPICYGNGGTACGRSVRRVEQCEPARLPASCRHGTEIAYSVYGCRCRECSDWKARDAMGVRKSGRG